MKSSHLSRGPATRKRLLVLGIVTAIGSMMGMVWAHPATAQTTNVSVTPTTVSAGETFTISISGTSPGNYSNETLAIFADHPDELEIPQFTTLVGCTGSAEPCSEFGPFGYGIPLGDLTTGEAFDVTITLRVDSDAAPTDFVVQYIFVLRTGPGSELMNGPTVTITQPTPPEADLSVSLVAGPAGLLTSQIHYSLQVTNHGPDQVNSATIETSFTRPVAGVSSVDGCVLSGGRAICPVGPIPPGGSVTKSFDAHLGLLTIGLPFSATAVRTASDPADPNPANDSSTDSCTVISPLLVSC